MHRAIPDRLYTASDLIDGFNPFDDLGFTLTRDFATFRQFAIDGGPVPPSLEVRTAQADHDAAIADALRRFLDEVRRPLVGIMGGHAAKRNGQAFADIARLAFELVQEGYLIVTGGGPGVMEAAHVGVAFSKNDAGDLDKALAKLAKCPDYGNLDDLFEPDGTVKNSKRPELIKARNWLQTALEVRSTAPPIMPLSVAIPTWLYGAEPTMPFATHYAKYFQNSLREEALVNNSRAGIVYGQGGGGTMREVFQDVERNYYAKCAKDFTPMIFYDKGGYWRTAATYEGTKVTTFGIKLNESIPTILKFGICARLNLDDAGLKTFLDKIVFSEDLAVIKNVLKNNSETAQRNLNYALEAQPLKIASLRMNRV
jgi:predicted Rossmann-fold nucleotide-binding protein